MPDYEKIVKQMKDRNFKKKIVKKYLFNLDLMPKQIKKLLKVAY